MYIIVPISRTLHFTAAFVRVYMRKIYMMRTLRRDHNSNNNRYKIFYDHKRRARNIYTEMNSRFFSPISSSVYTYRADSPQRETLREHAGDCRPYLWCYCQCIGTANVHRNTGINSISCSWALPTRDKCDCNSVKRQRTLIRSTACLSYSAVRAYNIIRGVRI